MGIVSKFLLQLVMFGVPFRRKYAISWSPSPGHLWCHWHFWIQAELALTGGPGLWLERGQSRQQKRRLRSRRCFIFSFLYIGFCRFFRCLPFRDIFYLLCSLFVCLGFIYNEFIQVQVNFLTMAHRFFHLIHRNARHRSPKDAVTGRSGQAKSYLMPAYA